MTSREIAEDFIKRMNPSMWAGVGRKPDDFDTRIVTYAIDGFPEYKLDIYYDEDEEFGYVVIFELRMVDDGKLIYILHSRRIDSEDAIESSINFLIDDL